MLNKIKNTPKGFRVHQLRKEVAWRRFQLRQKLKGATKSLPWSQLRAMATSQIVRITMLTPFVGYLILLNEQLINYLALYPAFSVFSTQTPWSLIFLYFGSLLTGVSSLFYALRCPSIQKKYADFPDYRNAERDLWRNPAFAAKKVEEVRVELARDTHDMGIPGLFSSRNHLPLSNLQSLAAEPEKVDQHLFMEWNIKDHSRPTARLTCFVFYALGLVLIIIPSGLTLVKVFQFTMDAFWNFLL